jgi:5'-nucleotidase
LRILVSNDDGINARGIRALASRLAREPGNEVYVCAPDRERSATGHALTLHKPLRVEEVEFDANIKGAWYTTGTPSDCVKFAFDCLLSENVDYIVSGINSGPNLGSEILYSGTVSAAMEGAFLDIPSIAVSTTGEGYRNYDVGAEFIARLLKVLPQAKLSGKCLLNVNVPNVKAAEIADIRVTKLGVRAYKDWFEKRVDPRGKTYYWFAGEAIEEGEEENTDAWCVAHNMISVTPIAFNMTDFQMMEKLQAFGQLSNLLGGSGASGINSNHSLSRKPAK